MSAENAARFTIAGSPATDPVDGDRGYDALNSAVLAIQLEDSPSPGLTALYEVFDPADPESPLASFGADLLTFTGSGTASELVEPADTAVQLTMPASGFHSWILRCTVSLPGRVDVFERMVVIRGLVIGLRRLVPGESTQYSHRAWADEINAVIFAEESGVGPGEANTASNVGTGAGVFKNKVGVDLRFKRLKQGLGVTITENTDDIEFDVAAVVGPGSADDEAIARFDGVTGTLIQNSPVKISDAGAFRDWIYNRIAPAALVANADDYAPAGWDDADLLVQDTTGGNWTITGFAAITATAGVLRKLVLNESDECVLTLAHADGASAAANQILCPGDENIHLKPREAIVLVYDTTATRWRVIGRSEEHLTTYNFQGDSAGSTEDDYAPTGAEEWASADVVEITCPEGGTVISGFDASALVQERKIIVAGDDEGLTIQHQGAGSLAANRINCPRSVDMVLSRYEAAMLMYDGTVWAAVALSETAAVYTIEETIAAQADDYEPSNWATLDMLRVQLTGSQTITGFVALSAHNYKSIVNADTTDTLTLAHESASSAAGNRIITPTGTNLAIPPGHVAELAYDSVESRWRVVSVIARAATTAPVDVTKAAASAGTDPDYARRDHKHDITTAAPAATGVATASAEGASTAVARADHAHQANTAPVNVTKAAAAIGTSGEPARADHKHDIDTAAPTQGIGGGNTEGVGTALARSDHDHKLRETGGPTDLTIGSIGAGEFLARVGTVVLGVTPATTTDVLTGTNTTRPVTSDALAALWEKGSDVASAATVALGEGGLFHITGVTTITDIDFATPKDGREADLVFDSVLTLTHNATTLPLPGGANIVTAAGDRMRIRQDNGDNLVVLFYQRATGTLIPVFWGGASMGGGDVGKHFTAHGDANDNLGRAAALDRTNQMVMSQPGRLHALSWNTATADGTTVYKVNKNGVVVETITLSGASGVNTTLTTTYVAGDKIAVEYDAGTAPGEGTVHVIGAVP